MRARNYSPERHLQRTRRVWLNRWQASDKVRVARHLPGGSSRRTSRGEQGSFFKFRGPVREQRDRSGFRVVGGLDNKVFAVGADVVADPGEIWEIKLE